MEGVNLIINSNRVTFSIEYIKDYIESVDEIKCCMLKIKNDKKWGAVLFASYDYQSNGDYSQLINKITKIYNS